MPIARFIEVAGHEADYGFDRLLRAFARSPHVKRGVLAGFHSHHFHDALCIDPRAIRGTRQDSLFPEELANTVTLRWTLRDARDPTKVLATGSSKGTSQLFVSANLQTARNNALPEALERASEALVSRIANGY